MKNIIGIALVSLISLNLFSQELDNDKNQLEKIEQQAILQTKKMTLILDLEPEQQDRIFEINKSKVLERNIAIENRKLQNKKGRKLTDQELFDSKSANLDRLIAHQNQMKKILNPEQYKVWRHYRLEKAKAIKKRKMLMRVKRQRIIQHKKFRR